MIDLVQQNFLNPLGLTALLSLIPLIIFYLVKPKPEKEIMPAMTFFEEEKQEGKIKNSISRLKANRFILLHILFILLAASAIANPLIPGLDQVEDSVIVLDTSASMKDDTREMKRFATRNLGEENTLITAGSSTEVLAEDVSKKRAENIIKKQENEGSGNDILKALRQAKKYSGGIFIASDMSPTVQERRTEMELEEISENKQVQIMDLEHSNSHGFTDLDVQTGGEVSFTVQSFEETENSIEIRKPGNNIKTSLKPGEIREFQANLSQGAHKIKLPNDEMKIDNTLHISIPKENQITAKTLGEERKHFKKAIQLIEQTKYLENQDTKYADITYISENYDTGEKAYNRLEKGSKIIMEDRENLPSFSPVKDSFETFNTSVKVDGQVPTRFSSEVTKYDSIKGSSLANPKEAIVLSEDKQVLFYNVEDRKFGQKITYPIFWKNTILKMQNQRSIESLHLETGQQNYSNQEIRQGRMNEPGFYGPNQKIALNHLKAKESKPDQIRKVENNVNSGNSEKQPIQKYLSALLSLIALSELLLLSQKGEI